MNQTVIVFREDCILASSGREGKNPSLTRVKRIELQRFGDSFVRWQQALTELKEEWRPEQARLVLPASMCATRILQIPHGRKRQLAEMAVREVRDSFKNEIADYSILNIEKKESVDICAGGAEKENLNQFREICTACGIAISSITVPMEGYLQVLKRLDSYWNRTAVYLFFEEESMTSVLCQNGRYLYSSRSRIFSERGTLDFGTEIVRSISGILQFYAAGKREQPITEVYYAGCPDEDFEVSVEGIHNMQLEVFSLEVGRGISVPSGEAAADWLSCIGAMMRDGRSGRRIDLYRAVAAAEGESDKGQSGFKALLLPGILLAGCLGAWGVVAILNFRVSRQIASDQAWIQDPEIQEEYRNALRLEETLRELKADIAAVERLEENLSVYADFDSDILHRIESAGGRETKLSITGYDARTGVLTFEASSKEVIDIPDYILKLQQTGLFHTVDYTGYAYENEWYTLSLSCTMEGKISSKVQDGEGGGA